MMIRTLASACWEGSFGTVIANIAAENGNQVAFWMRDPIAAESVNTTKENSRYMPGYTLSSNLIATSDLSSVSGAEVIFSIPGNHSVLSVSK